MPGDIELQARGKSAGEGAANSEPAAPQSCFEKYVHSTNERNGVTEDLYFNNTITSWGYILLALVTIWTFDVFFFYSLLTIAVQFGSESFPVMKIFLIFFAASFVFVVIFVIRGYINWKKDQEAIELQDKKAQIEEREYERAHGI